MEFDLRCSFLLGERVPGCFAVSHLSGAPISRGLGKVVAVPSLHVPWLEGVNTQGQERSKTCRGTNKSHENRYEPTKYEYED